MAGKTNTNTTADAKTNAGGQGTGQPSNLFSGVEVDDQFFKTFVPQTFQGIDRSATGIINLLSAGGVPGNTIAEIRGDAQNGGARLNAILQSPEFQEKVAKRINVKPTETQVSEAKGGEKPAGEQKGEKPKPKTPVLPKPQSPAPQTEGVKSFMGISGAASKIGGQRGGPLKMVREEITPDGGRVTVTEFYEPGPGNTLSPVGREVADSAGNVVASEGVTDTTAPKQDEKPAKAPRKTVGEWAKKENRPTLGERFDANMEGFEKRGGNPNLANQAAVGAMTGLQHFVSGALAAGARNWPAALGAAALGAGANYMLRSGTSAPANQPPTMMDPSQYMSLFGTQPQPPQQAAPKPQAQPQPAGNPAGTPADNNTTLMQLQRMMQSREYA